MVVVDGRARAKCCGHAILPDTFRTSVQDTFHNIEVLISRSLHASVIAAYPFLHFLSTQLQDLPQFVVRIRSKLVAEHLA
jgi:hypothetical protein